MSSYKRYEGPPLGTQYLFRSIVTVGLESLGEEFLGPLSRSKLCDFYDLQLGWPGRCHG